MAIRTFEDVVFPTERVSLYPFKGENASAKYMELWAETGFSYGQERQNLGRAFVSRAVLRKPGEAQTRGYIAIEVGGICQTTEVFATDSYISSLQDATIQRRADLHRDRAESQPTFLFPLDPRITAADIDGATIWYPNQNNTGWLFGHCDKDFHLDYEYRLTSALNSVFAREKDLTHDASDSALYSVLLNNTSDTRHEWGRKTRVLDNLRKFHAQTELELLKEHKAHPLGYYQRNPHEAHLHEPILRAIRKVEKLWAEDNEQAIHWRDLKPVVARIRDRVRILFPYETRWDQAARLKAEAEDDAG